MSGGNNWSDSLRANFRQFVDAHEFRDEFRVLVQTWGAELKQHLGSGDVEDTPGEEAEAETSETGPSFLTYGKRDNAIAELLREYVPGRKPLFSVAVVTTIVWRLANLVPPYLLGVAMDGFFSEGGGDVSIFLVPDAWIPESTTGEFAAIAVVFGAVCLLQVVTYALRFVSWRQFQQSVLHELRVDTYEATQRLDMEVFDTEQTGDVMSVLNNDVNQLRGFLDDGMQSVLHTGAFYIGLAAVMLGLHWQLTVVVFGFAVPMLVVVKLYQRLIEPRYNERRAVVGKLNSQIENTISGIETVKSFTNERREQEKLERRSRAFAWADWKAAIVSGVFFPARQLVSLGVAFAIVALGGYWALFGPPLFFTQPLSPGTFITFFFLGQMFVGQTARLGDVVDTYSDAKASAGRVMGLYRFAPDARSNEGAPVALEDGGIEFENVTFSYPNEDELALEEISFEVTDGSYVGIVGPTGAGKSTVLKLLLQFYAPDDGTIRVGGTPLRDADPTAVRDAIGYVGQNPYLFDETVVDNIRYGDTDADREAVKDAAKRARAHEFITDLEDGYDTEIGENGSRLSGGQRQRLTITRTILKDPEVLLLDEATSHVDNRTEMQIQYGLNELIEDRTTIAIAHSLATVRDADKLLVFDDGRIENRGSHDELEAEGGIYADMWNLHVGEDIGLDHRTTNVLDQTNDD